MPMSVNSDSLAPTVQKNLLPLQSTVTQSTALHEAASAGSLECVQYLMSMGSDKAALNWNGETPFDCTTELEIRE